MFKRLLCLVLVLALCPVTFSALAEESDASALDWEELIAWAQGYKARAMEAKPFNNPSDPSSFSEDGYAFIYDFATLYMDRPEMTEESVLRNLVITSPMETGPRGTRIDMLSAEVLEAYYNENDRLAGERGFAGLYLSDTLPAGGMWAWVQRDGQRIMTIQYAVHEQLSSGGDGYTDAGLVYTIQENLVAAIRAYGLDAIIDEEGVRENLNNVQQVLDQQEYKQVPISYEGLDLLPFDEEDLVFAGLDFADLTPEMAQSALGACLEDQWMQDDTGEYIRSMDFGSCEITFIYDSKKQNPRIDLMAIDADGLEGPRCVRIGDTFSSVLIRFRYGEGEFDGVSERLYGQEGQGNWGTAEYGDDASATLRYATRTQDGRNVLLYLFFEQMNLAEILLYVND